MMFDKPRVLAAMPYPTLREWFDQTMVAAAELELAGVIDKEGSWDTRDSYSYDALVVVGDDRDPTELYRIIADGARDPGGQPVVVLAPSAPANFVQRVLEAGADDIIIAENGRAPAELSFAVQKALARRHGAPTAGERSGQLIVVLGPKGGTGKTLTAANLATALALSGRRVTLVDLDLQFGDLGLVMGLKPERTLFDLATSGGTLDLEKIEAFTCQHASGVNVLLAPIRPDQASVVTSDFLRNLYEVLAQSDQIIVVDTPPGFTPEVIASIDASSRICMLGMLDAPSLKNAKLGLETLELMGYPAEQIRLVLNRADTNVGISHADVVRILGRAPDVLVPSSRDIVRSINLGEPLVASKAKSEAGKAFRALSDLFMSELPSQNGRTRSRGFRLLSRA